MLTAFQKVIAKTETGILHKKTNEYPQYYELIHFRVFESSIQNKVDIAIVDQSGGVVVGFRPMTYEKAMEIIENAISEEQFEEQIEITTL